MTEQIAGVLAVTPLRVVDKMEKMEEKKKRGHISHHEWSTVVGGQMAK